MGFKRDEVDDLLVRCHRRCCICHRFCGTKIETDHIDQRAESQDNSIDNAIPVCFECHAEIHSYNDKHPRGRKFKPEELRKHRDQWLKICDDKPETLLQAARDGDVGPVQAMLDELEFNKAVEQVSQGENRGALFENAQFRRAIQEGSIGMLDDSLKESIIKVYAAISKANQWIIAELHQDEQTRTINGANAIEARKAIASLRGLIEKAHAELSQFLRGEGS